MHSEALLKEQGMRVLSDHLGIVDSERFITLIRRGAFDYTQWRQGLFLNVPLDNFLQDARDYRERLDMATTEPPCGQ